MLTQYGNILLVRDGVGMSCFSLAGATGTKAQVQLHGRFMCEEGGCTHSEVVFGINDNSISLITLKYISEQPLN